MAESENSAVRTLDSAVPASIDHIALNNQVVAMRKTVKRTKVQLINRMVKRIRVLKNCTKGGDLAIAKKRRKAERILKEIEVIKRLNPDKVSKFALANTSTVKDFENLPCASETKAMARYSNHKLMQDLVMKFREKHPDWKALAAYLLSKNSGRRYKKKSTKEKITAEAAATNKKAGETLMRNFLEQKGVSESDKTENSLKVKNKEKRKRKDTGDELSVSELKKSVDTFEDSVPGSKVKRVLSESDLSESDSEVVSRKKKLHKKDSSDSKLKAVSTESEGQNYVLSLQRKSMVIQSFSLHDTTGDTLPVNIESQKQGESNEPGDGPIPGFLQTDVKSTKPARLKRDAFFMGGEDDVDSGTESVDAGQSEEDTSDIDDNAEQLDLGKMAMRSTFVGSLTDNRREKMASWAHRHGSVRRTPHSGKGQFPNKKWRGEEPYHRDNTYKSSKQNKNYTGYRSGPKPFSYKQDSGRTNRNFGAKPSGAKPSPVKEKLHPSWEASKLRKQQMTHIQAFQGKKTTFSDDD